MFKHLLVPLDGSLLAEAALPVAVEIASRFDSDLTLLRVTRPPAVASSMGQPVYAERLGELRDWACEEATGYLKQIQNTLRQQGYKVQIHVTEGEPAADVILETAAGFGIDTIVMSTHGRSGISRWVFGSVADRVLRQSNIPVLIVRANEEALHWSRQPPARADAANQKLG